MAWRIPLVDLAAEYAEVGEAVETAVLAIVTLPSHPRDAFTVNLQGPLVIDLETGRGWQVIVTDSPYGTPHPIDLALPGV